MPTNRHSKRPRPLDALSAKQAGQVLKVQPGTLSRYARLGKLQVIKVGKLNFFPTGEVRRLVWADNVKTVAERMITELEQLVTDNNATIAKEARSGRRKD